MLLTSERRRLFVSGRMPDSRGVVILGKYASVISGDEVGPLTAIGVFHQPQAQGAQTRKPAVGIDARR